MRDTPPPHISATLSTATLVEIYRDIASRTALSDTGTPEIPPRIGPLAEISRLLHERYWLTTDVDELILILRTLNYSAWVYDMTQYRDFIIDEATFLETLPSLTPRQHTSLAAILS